MLIFNPFRTIIKTRCSSHLNTSHVNLQPQWALQEMYLKPYLNTSHVNLQLGVEELQALHRTHLNTSHVNLQPEIIHIF